MSHFLFFSLAKHQSLYFQRLLDQTELQGKVITPRQLPWPRIWAWREVAVRLDWLSLIEEKCRERRVKNKYQGTLYRLLLRLELLWVGLRIQALVTRERPPAVVMWNGSHRYCQLLLALIPAGTKTFFFENGLLPNTTTLDSKGVNYRNSVPRDPAFFLDYQGREHGGAQETVRLVPRKPRSSGLAPIALPERFVFIPFQDDRDTQVRLFSPWVGDMRQLFALGEMLAEQAGLTVIVKEHPSSRATYPDLHRRTTERLLFANGNNTQELIEASLFVVTLNSTVGLESLLLAKPVVTLGQAFFNIEGLVMHARSANELLDIAQRFPDWPLNEEVRQNFLRYMAEVYCVPGGWQAADKAHLQVVASRMLGCL